MVVSAQAGVSYVLTWLGRRGIAQRGSRVAELHGPPDLGRGPVDELQYFQAAGVRVVRERAIDPRRDLTVDEERAARELVRAFHPSGPAPL